MRIDNLSAHSSVTQWVQEALIALPGYWKTLLEKIPCQVIIAPEAIFMEMQGDGVKKYKTFFFGKNGIIFYTLFDKENCYEMVFTSPDSPEWVDASGIEEYLFKKYFLQACARALFFKNKKLNKWVKRNAPGWLKGEKNIDVFFSEGFSRKFLRPHWIDKSEEASDEQIAAFVEGADAALAMQDVEEIV